MLVSSRPLHPGSRSALLTPVGWALTRDTLNARAAPVSGARGGYCRSTQGCSRRSRNHSGWHRPKASLLLPHTHGPAPCSMDKHCACETWPAARRKAGVKQWFPIILDRLVYLLICKQRTDKMRGVLATLVTHTPFIATPAPTLHGWVEFLQFPAVFMSVPRSEEGKHAHKEGGFHISAKHGWCV